MAKNRSEVTLVIQASITDIFPVANDEALAEEEIRKEIDRIKDDLSKLKWVSNVDVKSIKTFQNIKS